MESGSPTTPSPDATGVARPRLAVPYDLSSASPMDTAAALSDLCDIVWIAHLADPDLATMGRLLRRLGAVIDTEGRDPEQIAGRVAEAHVDGVVAFCDSQLSTAAIIAARLGLPGNPPDIIAGLNDKYAQRAALAAAGVPGPRFVRLDPAPGVAAALDAVAGFRFPLVVKPLHGESSRDVVAVEDGDALAAALAGRTDGLIVEEFLTDDPAAVAPGLGRYVSAEVVVQDGVAVPVALTGKFPLVEPFRETGNFMPHPLDAIMASEVLDLAIRAAAALGVRSGVLHTEVKLTPDGPRVIEVNGRVGGGAIDLLHRRRFGVSLTELAARVALGVAVDTRPDEAAASGGPFLYEFFLQPPTDVTGLVGFGGADGVIAATGALDVAPNKSPGDDLDWRRGSQGFVLRVGGVADDMGSLTAIPAAVESSAAITYR